MKIQLSDNIPPEGKYPDAVIETAEVYPMPTLAGEQEVLKIQVRIRQGVLSRVCSGLFPPWHLGKLWNTLNLPLSADGSVDTDDLLGLKVTATIKHNAKNGRTYANVVEMSRSDDSQLQKRTSNRRDGRLGEDDSVFADEAN